jgi:ketosteroid isomerase-like protein
MSTSIEHAARQIVEKMRRTFSARLTMVPVGETEFSHLDVGPVADVKRQVLTMPREVTAFFEHYRDAFNRLDGEAIADLFCVPSGIVSDRGLTTWQSREPIAKNMTALCDLYRANGYKQASFQPRQFLAQGREFAVADVEWSIEREGGAAPWRFHTTYNLRLTADGWRVILCTAYEEQRLNA